MSVYVDLAFLSRTIRISYAQGTGTGVYVEIGGIQFIITAAHVVTGLAKGDSLGIRYANDWAYITVEACVRCAKGSDICVIRPSKHFGEGLQEGQLSSEVIMGQDVVYCGFPLGLEMEGLQDSKNWPTPLVKAAIFSGALGRGNYTEYLFDTINNRGFSGGPIIKRDPKEGKLTVVGIVSGYKFDSPLPVRQRNADGTSTDTADYWVQPNSGFMVGIPIHLAVETAKAML